VKKVLFLGDLNVDIILDGLEAMPVTDREVGCESFDLEIGSSACIAACAYSCLGGSAWLCGLAGKDHFGDFLLDALHAKGVRVEEVTRDSRLRTGVTVNLVKDNARSQVTYPGSMAEFSLAHVTEKAMRNLRHLHVSGVFQAHALLPDLPGLMARAREAGATVSLDCQWDPSERWEGLERWLALVNWFFANTDEACSMTGKTDAEGAARELASRTACPVIKAGKRGALFIHDGRIESVPAPEVTLVDTVGAGDNFDAGFLYATLEKEMALPEAVRFANAAAALSCAHRGGTAACSTAAQVEAFLQAPRQV